MTDPWATFVARTSDREVAGYFEASPRAPRGASTATWFGQPGDVRTLDRDDDAASLGAETRRFLRGGAGRAVVGYLGFDAVGLFEPALRRFPAGDPFPLGELAWVRRPTVVRWHRLPARRAAGGRSPGTPLADSLARTAYERSVRRIGRDIRDGEAFQVVLAHRRVWPRPAELLTRAGVLRASERYAFFVYLRFGDRELVAATPESVAEVEGRTARVNPIAGTIPIGRGRAGRRPLAVDPKELAEHRMLVDLARNDLGRVARPGSVRLGTTERRVRFARLEHLVSEVEATLATGTDPWAVLAAAFPAGTVSGAPKIRATEILRREEGTWRGPYAGALGLLRPRDRATWALGIRAGFAAGRRLYTAAGAGIVYRSRPAREFHETIVKLAQVERTLAAEGP
ncbi:MAG TPA: chorismate-binding protein [Thermoplasmata archaeon]|nr:chorismate-binding protein [Thermoplasmata archaeon]HTW56398.1 chorismate-binding protein [Thermoplasmata archaeon]